MHRARADRARERRARSRRIEPRIRERRSIDDVVARRAPRSRGGRCRRSRAPMPANSRRSMEFARRPSSTRRTPGAGSGTGGAAARAEAAASGYTRRRRRLRIDRRRDAVARPGPRTPGTLGIAAAILRELPEPLELLLSKPRTSTRRPPRSAAMMRVSESLSARSNRSDSESASARSPFATCESRRAVTRLRIGLRDRERFGRREHDRRAHRAVAEWARRDAAATGADLRPTPPDAGSRGAVAAPSPCSPRAAVATRAGRASAPPRA